MKRFAPLLVLSSVFVLAGCNLDSLMSAFDSLTDPSNISNNNNEGEGEGQGEGQGEGEVVLVTSIAVPNAFTLYLGSVGHLTPTISPTNATNKNVVYGSDNENVLTVNENGDLTPLSTGTAHVTVAATDNSGVSAVCTITVKENTSGTVRVSSVTLNKTSTEIEVGKNETLVPTVLPEDAANKGVTWKSSSSSIATVTSAGQVFGLKAGTVTITCTSKDNTTVYATCQVTVKTPIVAVTGVKLDTSSTNMYVGSSRNLTATVSPTNATNKNVTWATSNSSIVSVTQSGTVTANAIGTATITVTTEDGGYTATCTITVKEKTAGDLDDFTLLVYMCGADLESQNDYATADIKEILSVSGQPDDVNIVFATGGAKSWASTYGISSTVITYAHAQNKSFVKDKTVTKASMGKKETLRDFIVHGVSAYPAERYGLILWNHGGAMSGVCFDENYSSDSLTNIEVRDAVNAARTTLANKGVDLPEKLDFIGYDACLMQLQDIAYTNASNFKYMIGSEESEAGEGWAYSSWIDDIYAHKSTEEILTANVDGFIAEMKRLYSQNRWGDCDQTLSWLDLSYAEEYKTAWENMASALKNKLKDSDSDGFNELVETCKTYAEDGSSNYYYGMIDAKDFLNKLVESDYAVSSTYTDAVYDAFSHFVGYSQKGSGAGQSYGLCMYWGQDSDMKSYYSSSYTSFSNWLSLVNNYGYNVQGGGSGGGWWW